MTDDQLKQGKELKSKISTIEGELEKFEEYPEPGTNVFLPNVSTLIEDVRKVFVDHLNKLNKQFKEL